MKKLIVFKQDNRYCITGLDNYNSAVMNLTELTYLDEISGVIEYALSRSDDIEIFFKAKG